jgi:xylan 1,4-beta-xylosidase
MTTFTCDLTAKSKPLVHFWEHTLGSGHATLALRADYQAQLLRCHRELGIEHGRFHGILSDDMGTLIISENKKIYSFFNADCVMDFLISVGMKPLVELSFMPSCIAKGVQTVMHYHDIVTPPLDYADWAELIDKLVRHWVDRYGIEEVRTWPFEVWNEPNLAAFWSGDQADYFRLYETTARAIKAIDSKIPVGGPVTAANAWIPEFLDFCKKNDVPFDFVSTHLYPTDALGTGKQDTVSELAHSPRDVMRTKAVETRSQVPAHRPLYYTEWSSSSNPHDPLHDEPFAATFAARTILENVGIVDAYSWWTFSDIFDENYFPSEPYNGGFGLLNLYGVPKPVYRAYELLHSLGDTLLTTAGSHSTVNVYPTRGADDRLTILLTNFALPRHPLREERVEVRIAHCPAPRGSAYIRRVDAHHSNPRRVYEAIGSPEYPTPAQIELLEAASACGPEPIEVTYESSILSFHLDLPAYGVAAVTIHLSGEKVPS